MTHDDLEERKKELTRIIASELKNVFKTDSTIMAYIQELERTGLTVDITILTALTIEEKTAEANEAHKKLVGHEMEKLIEKDLHLSIEDKKFLHSLKLTY
ncbi:hypothetical protein JXQ70_00875 [bacterium]|nr:hypothetical protein [bacterium]